MLTHLHRAMLLTAIPLLVSAQALPSADAILDRYVEVTGGKAAYQKLTSEVLEGTIAFPEQGISGKLTRYSAAPDKEYSVVELGPIGKIESGFANGVAWDKSAMIGPRVKAGEERQQALREARFNSAYEWRSLFSKTEIAGTETIDGEECDKVTLTPRSGRAETQFYSKKSGLLMKTVLTAASPMGDVNVESTASDYKDFGGILYPSRTVQKAAAQKVELTITNISFNQPIPAEYFDMPAEIKALLPKAKAVAK